MTIQLDGYRVITGVCRRRSHGLASELRLVSRSHVALHHSPVSNPADHLVPESGHKLTSTDRVQEAAGLLDLDVTADEAYARHVCRKRTDIRRTRGLVKVGSRRCLAYTGASMSQKQTCDGAALRHTGLPKLQNLFGQGCSAQRPSCSNCSPFSHSRPSNRCIPLHCTRVVVALRKVCVEWTCISCNGAKEQEVQVKAYVAEAEVQDRQKGQGTPQEEGQRGQENRQEAEGAKGSWHSKRLAI